MLPEGSPALWPGVAQGLPRINVALCNKKQWIYQLWTPSASSELCKLLASTKSCGEEVLLLNSMLPEKSIPFLVSLSLVPVDLIKMLKPLMSKASKATLVPESVHCSGVAPRYKYNNILLHTHLEIFFKKGKHVLLKSMMSEGIRHGFDVRNCPEWEILMSLSWVCAV